MADAIEFDLDDLIPSVIDDLGANILKASCVPVGTEKLCLVFEIDHSALWAKIRAALRARGQQ